MFNGIAAPPGGGKSRFATDKLYEEFRADESRFFVTNLAIQFAPWVLGGRLQCGLDEKLRREGYRGRPARERIRILTEEETKTFWRIRDFGPPKQTIIVDPDGTCRVGIDPDNGVSYFIDELHDHFNSHEWSKMSKEALFYISKHRHLGDDIWGISQAMSNVVKQMRVIMQQTFWIENLALQRLGFFRLPRKTLVRCYLGCPDRFVRGEEQYTVIKSYRDGSIQECYNTAAAVRNSQSRADFGQDKRGGVHWIWFIIAVAVVIAAIWLASELIPAAIVHHTGPEVHPAPVSNAAPSSVRLVSPGSTASSRLVDPDRPEVYMTGYARVGDGFTVFLSDGREYRTGDPELLVLERKRVNIGGVWIPLGNRPLPPSAAGSGSNIPPAFPVSSAFAPSVVASSPVVPGTSTRQLRIVSQGLRAGADGAWHSAPTRIIGPE